MRLHWTIPITKHLCNLFLYVPLWHRFSRPLLHQLPLPYGAFTQGLTSTGRNNPLGHELTSHRIRMHLFHVSFKELAMAGGHGLYIGCHIIGGKLFSSRESQIFNQQKEIQ